jgi:transposase-like protein
MFSFDFKGLPQLLKRFPDDASARQFMEQERWQGSPICPFCNSDKWYKLNDSKTYKCGNKECRKKYTITVNTIFHGSHIPLNIWFAGMYIICSHKKGISSHQLAKDLDITQKGAWYMLHRLRELLREKKQEKLKKIVEADETYMGRKFAKGFQGMTQEEIKYKMKTNANKGVVVGMVERKGRVIVKSFDNNDKETICSTVRDNVEKGSRLHTDATSLYRGVESEYYREFVTHGRKEWVRESIVSGKVTTNTVENYWSVMRRGIYGTYHQISVKHLERYCDEFSFRYNSRSLADNERFVLSLSNASVRLKYKDLIRK